MINTFPEYNCDPSKIDSMINKIINGPAIIDSNGHKEYWINSKPYEHHKSPLKYIKKIIKRAFNFSRKNKT